MSIDIGVIGGTGLYEISGFKMIDEKDVDTPFGKPSWPIAITEYEGLQVAFLSRHGKGHLHNPTKVNARANIFALKELGVKYVITVSAVGSLREDIAPRQIVIPDQIIDRTRHRINTFFEDFTVHISFADPYCDNLRKVLIQASKAAGMKTHENGTYICMEGPQFSTRAESHLYRSWGASVIGMTALPEAKLAREAELCYATIALPTDYDCWRESEEVRIEQIIENLNANIDNVKSVLKKAIPLIRLDKSEYCSCHSALENAIITAPHLIPKKSKEELELLIGKYIK